MNADADQRPAASARSDRVPLGIIFMLGATVMFAASSAISKWQVESFSFAEVLLFRTIASLATCALLILPRRGLSVLRTHRFLAHTGRNLTQGFAQSLVVIALGLMPLAGVMAINFSAPLFATLFAVIWLKERVGLARGLALVIGFLGVLLVASPGADSFRLGALVALGNAVLYGCVTTIVRGMSATELAETLTLYQMLMLTVFFAVATAIFGYTMPDRFDLLAMLVNGVLNGFGQYWWTRSLSLAPPAAVGPFYYFTLVWSMLLGFLFWSDIPTLTLLLGSGTVVGSGLYLLWHEQTRKPIPAD